MTFDRWWSEFGSFLGRSDYSTDEEHAEEIARAAWDEASTLTSDHDDDTPQAQGPGLQL